MVIPQILLRYQWFVLGTIALVYVVKKLFIYHRLRHVKGPPGTGFFGFWHMKALLSRNCQEHYAEAVDKYGSLARIAPNILVTSDCDVWLKINAPRSRSKRAEWFYTLYTPEPGSHTSISMPDLDEHRKTRKRLASGHKSAIDGLEEIIDEGMQSMVDLMRTKYLSTDRGIVPMDLAEKVHFLVGDVMSKVVLGRSFGMLTRDCDAFAFTDALQAVMGALQVLVCFGMQRLTTSPLLHRLLAPKTRDRTGIGRLMGEVFATVDARVAEAEEAGAPQGSDMLAAFMRSSLSGRELRFEALEHFIAGLDSTSTAIRAAMLFIMSNPRVCAKLQAEIDQAVADGRAPRRPVTIGAEQASALPYLQAVVRESQRVYPPVPGLLPRELPPAGETFVVDGQSIFVPGGTSIGCSIVALQRDKAVFGDDAHFFRPERWLEHKDAETLAAMVRVNDLIFCSGRYQCPGKRISNAMVPIVIFELMRSFNCALLKPQKPWSAVTLTGVTYIRDMWVQVAERSSP